ncbi:unnamed protein product [Lupinus luteus]|uniref:NHL repeat-containing protein n=1 Tax=Lupinus luteus TaxID=3873 RepID=A0AAV1XJR0_LUPLU
MGRCCFVMLFGFAIILSLFSTSSATPPAKIVTGVVSNLVSALLKRLWSLKSPAKPVQHTRSMMKFESGYNVDTIFDGSKLGIEPHSIEISPNGEYLVLDSENSNIYEITSPMTRYSRPKLVAGSSEGYIGHIDGRPREARMNHPKGLTVDDRGNIYIADTMNMAIRKISDEGVSTIAGGKWGQVGGHVDGAGEDAKFSNDFDVIYVSSSCSLLVVDRGNQAIREIQLHQDDCTTYEYDSNMPLGIAVLLAAGFFGYMLALLQWRVRALFSSPDDPRPPPLRKGTQYAAQQRPTKSVRPPLIPTEDEEYEKSDESFFVSLGRLFVNSGSSMAEILGGLFSGGSKRKPLQYQYHQQQQQQHQNQFSNRHHHHHPNALPMQESFVIPDEDEPPPPLETRKAYPFMSNEIEKPQQFKRTRAYLNGWDGDYNQQQQQQQHRPKVQQQQQQQQVHQHQQQLHQLHTRYSSTPQSYYEESRETNEIVFGAVQEHDGRREAMVIKAVDYGDPKYSNNNIRPRLNYVGYSNGY